MDTVNKRTNFITLDIALMAMFTALISVCSWISIESVVPFTLQTFGIFITVALLGGKRGSLVVFIYILLGLIGVPVFSGFSCGLSAVLGPTGGYIIGFLFLALIMWLFKALIKNQTVANIIGGVVGLIVCYSFGTIWFMIVYTPTNGASITVLQALIWCVIPYIIPDLLKLTAAIMLSNKLIKFIPSKESYKETDETK